MTYPEKFLPLKILYEYIPQTTGCERCEEVNGDRIHWCCREFPPDVTPFEFDHIWFRISTWDKDKINKVIDNAIRSFLMSHNTSVGCPFYDNGCPIYEWRPSSCREFGLLDQASLDDAKEECRERYGEDYEYMDDCDLVVGTKISLDQRKKRYQYLAKRMYDRGYSLDPSCVLGPMHILVLEKVSNNIDDIMSLQNRVINNYIDLESAVDRFWDSLVKTDFLVRVESL